MTKNRILSGRAVGLAFPFEVSGLAARHGRSVGVKPRQLSQPAPIWSRPWSVSFVRPSNSAWRFGKFFRSARPSLVILVPGDSRAGKVQPEKVAQTPKMGKSGVADLCRGEVQVLELR